MPDNLIQTYKNLKNAYKKLEQFLKEDMAEEIYKRIKGTHINTLRNIIEKFDGLM